MEHPRADQVDGGEASLGDAQSHNPPDDPDYVGHDPEPIDTDTQFVGEGHPPPEERGNEDPAPNAP